MKVLLKRDVPQQGKAGEIITVSDGYARNYLIPRGLAVMASASAVKEVQAKEEARLRRLAAEKAAALELRERLLGIVVKIEAAGSSDDRLFGSVTSKDVSEALEAQFGISVDKKKILLAEPIRQFGSYTADARLYTEITGKINIVVCRK
ncbi:MAG: 50S ribosomal protein L9 [Clostridia bacterium]|nr:50S ribosomal protein L9 [Clostridia bacterium]MBP5269585.1 50S ribosomal protein L9 [Clostridia bacterium]